VTQLVKICIHKVRILTFNVNASAAL